MSVSEDSKNRYLQWLAWLIQIESVTPDDAGAQPLVAKIAASIGAPISIQKANLGQTSNIAITIGSEGAKPHCHFIGHTDVVPAYEKSWSFPPYELSIHDDKIYGRGTCDMKGAIVAFLAAYERRFHEQPLTTVTLLLTSDEEGNGNDGIQHLLQSYPKERVSIALIGEPTAEHRVGDRVKNARRGSLHGMMLLKGQHHHVAYPQGQDPLSFLEKLLSMWNQTDWDQGRSTMSRKTSFQITKIQTQECVENVIPGELTLRFNFRYIAETSIEQLQQKFIMTLKEIPLQYELNWRAGALPWTSSIPESDIKKIFRNTKFQDPVLCSGGGVSDGYKVAQHLTTKILEVGLPHTTAHHHDEHIRVQDFFDLIDLYEDLLKQIEC